MEFAKFCAKFLHQQVLKDEAYAAGDIGTSNDEMMCGQRGWRELAYLGDKINKFYWHDRRVDMVSKVW
ncbi:hypothetical protein NC651_017344 [Populus alba x Populus x berolinensis]|nr:hypothetical protein NC651_017344 [Populus alba x Populus x berolinensis]